MRVSSKLKKIHTACSSLPLSLLGLSHHGQWPSFAVVARVSSNYTQMYVKVFYGVLVKFPEITLIFQSISPILVRTGSNSPCIDQFSEYRPSALPRNQSSVLWGGKRPNLPQDRSRWKNKLSYCAGFLFHHPHVAFELKKHRLSQGLTVYFFQGEILVKL